MSSCVLSVSPSRLSSPSPRLLQDLNTNRAPLSASDPLSYFISAKQPSNSTSIGWNCATMDWRRHICGPFLRPPHYIASVVDAALPQSVQLPTAELDPWGHFGFLPCARPPRPSSVFFSPLPSDDGWSDHGKTFLSRVPPPRAPPICMVSTEISCPTLFFLITSFEIASEKARNEPC